MLTSTGSVNRVLKKRYVQRLHKHQHRYHMLLKKYTALERKVALKEDIGTPKQIMRDAKKYLSEEQILFLESQMILKNRPRRGNRFTKKFMRLLLEYYRRSKAGYKFLKTIFTLPSVKTLQNWLNRPLAIMDGNPFLSPAKRQETESDNDSEDNTHPTSQRSGKGRSDQYGESQTQRKSDTEEGSSYDSDDEESDMEDTDADEEVDKEVDDSSQNTIKVIKSLSDVVMEWEGEPWDTGAG